jgi:membrane protease YdiL (CAAX protease family)
VRALFSSRLWDLAELLIGYGLILAVIWTPGREQNALYWSAFLWIALTAWFRRKQTRPIGLGLHGLRRSLWIIPTAIVLFLIGIGLADLAHSLHNLYGPLPVLEHVGEYSLWSLMQQFILQVYVLLRLIRLGLRRGPAIAVASLMFAGAHIPNPVLVPAVLIWGPISCRLYLRYRNLYAIAVAHALLGMCIALCVPNSINHHMRVGQGYLVYPSPHRPGLEPTGR